MQKNPMWGGVFPSFALCKIKLVSCNNNPQKKHLTLMHLVKIAHSLQHLEPKFLICKNSILCYELLNSIIPPSECMVPVHVFHRKKNMVLNM